MIVETVQSLRIFSVHLLARLLISFFTTFPRITVSAHSSHRLIIPPLLSVSSLLSTRVSLYNWSLSMRPAPRDSDGPISEQVFGRC